MKYFSTRYQSPRTKSCKKLFPELKEGRVETIHGGFSSQKLHCEIAECVMYITYQIDNNSNYIVLNVNAIMV